jgi:hypothetical protein
MHNNRVDALIAHVKQSVEAAMQSRSKLPRRVLDLEGMSGDKTRHLYNNLCSLPGVNYLEIGTWKGSSFVSAVYGNDLIGSAFCVDDWSEFDSGRRDLQANIDQFLPDSKEKINVVEKDCWTLTEKDVPVPIDVYLYDGHHSYASQKRAITDMVPFLADCAVVIVDDWYCDWVDVKKGTLDGLVESGLHVHYEVELPSTPVTAFHQRGDNFWNGCAVFVCEKVGSGEAFPGPG